MAYAFSNKKKIRGWKNKIRRIERWYTNNKVPDLFSFEERHEDYSKIIIDPWYRLIKRNPPLWLFRIIFEKMLLIYFEWDKKFKSNGTPYDLQLWLFDPMYINSQLVCAKVNQPGDLRTNYFNKSNLVKAFPVEKFQCNNIEKFRWELYIEQIIKFEELDGLTVDDINTLIKKGYIEGVVYAGMKNEQRIFVKDIGDVWVGRLK